jgi:iron complex outermembrane recepter protein
MISRVLGCIALTIAVCIVESTAVKFAWSAELPPSSAPASTEYNGLEEVVVTARRVRENLQNVPIAITVYSGEALKEQNVVSVEDLNARVPSLQTSNSSGDRDQVVFSLRGLTQTYGGSAPAVVMYFADVPTFPAGPSLLYDLENLEVLKGPQG